VIAFHELAEAYEKIDGGIKDYDTGHANAIARELKLRDQQPYLKAFGLGSGDKGPASGLYRAIRGGNWDASPRHARVFNRNCVGPYGSDNDVGFRLVCSSK